MRFAGNEMSNCVFLFGTDAGHSLAASVLGFYNCRVHSFYIAGIGQNNDSIFQRHQVLFTEFPQRSRDHFSPSFVVVFIRDSLKFFMNNFQNQFSVFQN